MKSIFLIKFVLLLFLLVFLNDALFAQENKDKAILPDITKSVNNSITDSTKSKKAKPVIEPLKSLTSLPAHLSIDVIPKKVIETNDYRFTGHILNNSPFTFLKDLGYTGLPNEAMIYGQGYNSTSYFNDGIEIDNRLFNSFDLNLFQSESIYAIEVMPLARGFLLGNSNNASVNFISQWPSISKPYSRIKYYQAPDDEGFIDGIFSVNPFKKTNVFLELTNHSNGKRYTNSDYTNWMGDFRVNYFLSKEINLRLNYKHVSSTIQLNGGVNIDSIHQTQTGQFDDIIYDNILAPVRFTNRYQSSVLNHASFTILAKFIENAPSEFSFYYANDLMEYRQNNSGIIQIGAPRIIHDNKAHTFGVQLKQNYSEELLSILSVTKYERSVFNSPLFLSEESQTTFSSSVTGSINLMNGSFIPGLFAKYLNISGESYFGFGGDAVIHLGNVFSLYSGFSTFEKPYTILEQKLAINNNLSSGQNIQSAEMKISAKLDPVNLAVGYFATINDNGLVAALLPASYKNDEAYFVNVSKSEQHGLNLTLDLSCWKFLIRSNSSFYFSEKNRIRKGLPEFTSTGGIYYIDTLFNRNLKLKTGINYYGYGSRFEQRFDFEKGISSSYLYDPFIQTVAPNKEYLINQSLISPSFQIDFFLAGRIQDSAIIYFIWENLLGTRYSIVPGYPMHPNQIRFGFSWEFFD